MTAPVATATGNLETTPLSQLLVYALDKKLTGSFVFQAPGGGRSAVYLKNGIPRKAKTAEPVIHLGRLLLELGTIDEVVYNRTLSQVAKERKLHGQILLEVGAIDEHALEIGLSEQLMRQLLWLFELPARSAYGFYQNHNFLEKWAGDGALVEPLAVIWRGVRGYETEERLDATLARVASRALRLHPYSQLSRFRFSKSDQPLIDVMRARPMPIQDLIACGVMDPGMIKRILFTLVMTRHLDIGAVPIGVDDTLPGAPADASATARRNARLAGASRTSQSRPITDSQPSSRAPISGGPISNPPISSPPLSKSLPSVPPAPTGAIPFASSMVAAVAASPQAEPAPEETPADPSGLIELRSEVEQRLALIPSQNYYEILEVDRAAPGTAISAAFFAFAKRFHPDRLPKQYEAMRDQVTKLFSRMTEVHQTLVDTEKRREYDEILSQGGGTAGEQEQVQTIMRAVLAHQKAQVYLRKHNMTEAERFAKEAMQGDPQQAEYLALWVTIESMKPERSATGTYADLIEMMNDAVKREPASEAVRYARAELFKRAGRLEDAYADYRWVASHNPRNLEAVREVRLHTMRSPTKEKGGIFGKLFKR
jgi:tetratricopeptide (TPR) repeat protein